MRGNAAVVDFLNEALTAELTAVNQYFIHAKMLSNWGYESLASRVRDDSIDEMRDAETVIERILYLEGLPNMQRLNPVRVGETVVEQLRVALETEREAILRYNQGISLTVSHGDYGTREVLEGLLTGEEKHADHLESQLELVNQMGEAHYLSLQVR